MFLPPHSTIPFSVADKSQFTEQFAGFTQFFEIGNGCQRQIDMGIYQFFATRDMRQVVGCLRHGIQPADMVISPAGSSPFPMMSIASTMSSLFPPLVPTCAYKHNVRCRN